MAKFPSDDTLIGMVQSFETDPQLRSAPMFPVAETPNRTYSFDLVDGSRTIASYSAPGATAGVEAVTSRTRKTVILPTIRRKKMLDETTLRWLDGAGVKGPERAQVAIDRELRDLDNIIERTHEKARWDLLTTGQVDVDIEGNSETLDFGIGTTDTAGVTWDTIATADPMGDIVAWKDAVRQACGMAPSTMFISSTGLQYLMAATKTGSNFLGDVTKQEYLATGAVRRLGEMDVVIVDDGYRNSADAFKYFLSDDGTDGNMLVMVAGPTVGVTAQGAPDDSDAPDGLIGKFAKSWSQKDPSGRFVLECHTALPGLTKPNHVGAFTLW